MSVVVDVTLRCRGKSRLKLSGDFPAAVCPSMLAMLWMRGWWHGSGSRVRITRSSARRRAPAPAGMSLLEFFLLVCFASRFVQEVWKTCLPGLG